VTSALTQPAPVQRMISAARVKVLRGRRFTSGSRASSGASGRGRRNKPTEVRIKEIVYDFHLNGDLRIDEIGQGCVARCITEIAEYVTDRANSSCGEASRAREECRRCSATRRCQGNAAHPPPRQLSAERQLHLPNALLRLICYRARVVASPNLLPAVAGLRMQRWPRESAWMLVGNWCERSVKYAPEAAERLPGSRNESARTVAGDERSVDRRTAY